MKLQHIFRWRYREIRQRATKFSLLVTLLLFGLFFEAYMHNFNLVYITLFFVFALAFSAGPFGMRNIKAVGLKFDGCGRLFAEREGECRVKVTNRVSYPIWDIELVTDKARVYIGSLEANKSRRATVRFTPQKRGRVELGECYAESRFPLYTVRFQKYMQSSCEALVYPKPEGKSLDEYLNIRLDLVGDEGDFDGISRSDGMVSAARIHWASVAKGEVSQKVFEKSIRNRELLFEYDRLQGNMEQRLSQLTLWVLECEKLGLDFEIVLPTERFDSREAGIEKILQTFALYG